MFKKIKCSKMIKLKTFKIIFERQLGSKFDIMFGLEFETKSYVNTIVIF